MRIENIYKLLCGIFILVISCVSPVSDYAELETEARIDPDYTDIVLPHNIAPLNFRILDKAQRYHVEISSEKGPLIEIDSYDGVVDIPIRKWKKLLDVNKGQKLTVNIYGKQDIGWVKFKPIENTIAIEQIDSYLVYRILYPGYELWNDMGIYQRNLENFEQKPVLENKAMDNDCVNCHSFAANSPESMMLHIRGKNRGTLIYSDGEVRKHDIKAEGMPGGAVYPHWHPDGDLIAFSSNKIKQFFHASGDKYIEVSDFESNLLIYDLKQNCVLTDSSIATVDHLETFPAWSPNGNYLYYTRAEIRKPDERKDMRYDLMRVAFNSKDKTWGVPETIFAAAAIGKSVSFPRISPEGNFLVFTMADYGNFTIWHNEADLYKIDLRTLKTEILPVNSEWVESYHGWSSNGRWLVFSSKRRDTHCARPYFTYVNKNGKAHKPFIMPQKDPEFYDGFLKTFNIPELVTGEILVRKLDLINTALGPANESKNPK